MVIFTTGHNLRAQVNTKGSVAYINWYKTFKVILSLLTFLFIFNYGMCIYQPISYFPAQEPSLWDSTSVIINQRMNIYLRYLSTNVRACCRSRSVTGRTCGAGSASRSSSTLSSSRPRRTCRPPSACASRPTSRPTATVPTAGRTCRTPSQMRTPEDVHGQVWSSVVLWSLQKYQHRGIVYRSPLTIRGTKTHIL